MKILYIEDNKELALLVCTFLRGHGYEVDFAATGVLGLEQFYRNYYSWDAVIVDLELPDVTGHTLIPEIAAQRPNLPIVVYSGASGLKDRFELYTSGAAAVLSKPTSGQDLLDVLKGLTESPLEPIQ